LVYEISYQKNSVFLIGLGAIGMGYDYFNRDSMGITHARAIEKHPDFFCIGAYDLDQEKRIQFEREFAADSYYSLREGLQKFEPDVVIIATPTKQHLSTLVEVLSYCTPSVILCEKPLTIDSATGKEFLQFASNAEVPVFVNYFRNSTQSTFEIRDRISSGIFRQPFFGECRFNKGTLNTASHFLNLFELWFGPNFVFNRIDQFPNPFDESDPNLSGELVFPQGVISMQPDLAESELIFEVQLTFQNGVLFYSQEGKSIRWTPRALGGAFINDQNNPKIEFGESLNDYQYNVLTELSKFLDGKPHNLCKASSSLDYVMKLTHREV
jgi:predicted dehydrogenase